MISLLIGGTVVLCIGLLTVVFGIPIKEFSVGNTMILAGSIVSCTGLVLIGLYFLGREFRNLAQRLEAGAIVPAPGALLRERAEAPPKPKPVHEDTLFTRDQPPESVHDRDEFAGAPLQVDRSRGPALAAEPAASPPPWQDHPVNRGRAPAPPAESLDPPAEPAERPRRNIMFSSHRRDAARDVPLRDLSPPTPPEDNDHWLPAEDFQPRDTEPKTADPFDSAWPQPARSRPEPSAVRNDRAPQPATGDESDVPETPRERFQPPRRADESPVTIVKSGVVDSMAYSLYSDGSIEAQMPEGMVRFASIDELRSHLDERG